MLAGLACCLLVTLAAAPRLQAQERASDSLHEPVRFELSADRRLLLMSVAFDEVTDATVLRKLQLGLPTTIVLSAALYASARRQPLGSALQSCRVTWHVWEEMYWVELLRDGARSTDWSPTLSGVLRRCARADQLPLALVSALPVDRRLELRGQVLVNPLTPELLTKLQRWVSRPMSSTEAPGSVLFSAFTGLFMTRIGEADRVLKFSGATLLPAPPPAAGQ
jgi:hypothetical protein